MGVSLTQLLQTKEITIDELSGKTIAIDAMNILYQFVTTIRQYDGTPLKDSKGNVTSHLTGLFARCTKLMEKGLKLVFVFDGEMPKLKAAERKRREELKLQAAKAHQEAVEAQDVSTMKKYAGRTAKVTGEMIEEAKELLDALGIPHLTAPSEGEAQAGYMVKKGDCDYVASQDFDCLIYGAPNIVRNLSLSQKRKKINALTYKTIQPEILSLQETLTQLNLTLTQLRALAMLVGTDFNIGGIKGLGPKKSLTAVQKFGDDLEELFKDVEFNSHFDATWQEVFSTIKDMPTTDDYNLEWKDIDHEKVTQLLVEEHDFSKERVKNALESIEKKKKESQQKSLSSFFG